MTMSLCQDCDAVSPLRVEIGVVEKGGRWEAAVFSRGGVVSAAAAVSGQAEPAVVSAGVRVEDLLAAREVARLAEIEQALREGRRVSDADARRLSMGARAAAEGDAGGAVRGNEVVAALGESGMNAWWLNGSGDAGYHVFQNEQWLEVAERTLRLMLRRAGVADVAFAGEPLTEMEGAMLHVKEQRTLDRVAEGVAGYRRGVYEVGGRRILVQREARLLEPVKGDWSFLEGWLADRLRLEEGVLPKGEEMTQFWRFCFWLKRAVENVYRSPDSWLNSQVLILAGRKNCGKSQIQHRVITPLLGGRKADPSRFLFGETPFNEGWIGCEHLLVEDPRPSTKMLDRLQLAQILKSLVVNEEHTFHAKHRGEFAVDPQHVVSMSINDDPDALRILPVLTPDFSDKVLMLHVQPREFGMPTGTGLERLAFRERIAGCLPAFLYWLLEECVVPAELQDDRFGVREWHHPELRMSLWEESPSAELLAMLDNAVFRIGDGPMSSQRALWDLEAGGEWRETALRWGWIAEGDDGPWMPRAGADHWPLVNTAVKGNYRLWVGKSKELELALEEAEGTMMKKWMQHNSVARALGRLAEDCPDRVTRYRHAHGGDRYYVIRSLTPLE